MVSEPRVGLYLPRLSAYGGAESFALRLAEALARKGFDTTFICARREIDPPPGVKVIETGRPRLTKALKIAVFAGDAERVRKEERFDVNIGMGKIVYQDLLRASGGPLEVFWRLSARAWSGGFARGFKMLRRRLAPSNILIKKIERESLERSRRIVAVSHLVRDWLIQAHPRLAEKPIRVVYNKPDLKRFNLPSEEERENSRKAFGIEPGQVAVGLAGTNFYLKGVGPLIKAVAEMPNEFTALVAGGRRPDRFASLAKRLGVAGRVRFLGRVDDMPGFYKALDVYAQPSFYDTCSNAVLEALASGARVVSSNFDGSSRFAPKDLVISDPVDHKTLARIIESAAAAPRPGPFSWPEDVDCGLEPYIEMVRELAD